MLDWSMVLSFVTAAAAVTALALTNLQIRQSNKQALFERRIALWTATRGLMRLFEKHHGQFASDGKEPFFANDLLFTWLTNNAYLNEISPTLDHVLEQPSQRIFLSKLDELQRFSSEVKLIFKGKSALCMSAFLYDYQALLFAMYQYQILIKNMEENSYRFHWTLDEAVERLDERSHRDRLFETYNILHNSYDALSAKSIQRGVERQIRLS